MFSTSSQLPTRMCPCQKRANWGKNRFLHLQPEASWLLKTFLILFGSAPLESKVPASPPEFMPRKLARWLNVKSAAAGIFLGWFSLKINNHDISWHIFQKNQQIKFISKHQYRILVVSSQLSLLVSDSDWLGSHLIMGLGSPFFAGLRDLDSARHFPMASNNPNPSQMCQWIVLYCFF